MSVSSDIKLLVQHPRIILRTPIANWNSGVATSGQPGGDLLTYGSPGMWWRATEAYLLLSDFNAAATVTLRFYQILLGAMRYTGGDDWSVALDGPIIYLLWWFEVEMYGPLRIEAFSDQAADDGIAVTCEIRVKSW
jgi:hypothetical protein